MVFSLNHSSDVDGAPDVISARWDLNASHKRNTNIRKENIDINEPNLDTKFHGKKSCG